MKTDQVSRQVTRYAMIDASSGQEAALEKVTGVVMNWNKEIRDGFCLSQYGETPIRFFEVMKKNGPIVNAIRHQAQVHGLYPAYIVQEDKDHLPKEQTGTPWYVVDEVRYDLTGMDEAKVEAWKADYIAACKHIYREEHVFVKTFAYLGKGGVLHVMSFNTDRDPMSRDRIIGVSEWNEAMDKLVEALTTEHGYVPSGMSKKTVRYTNL